MDTNKLTEFLIITGKIEVHNPHKLQTHVLNKYFRHSKFASFQRQLNYFGFRKLAGKGKMAPCSYVNDATGNDLSSLLHIKRKVGEMKDKRGKKRGRGAGTAIPGGGPDSNVNPVLAGILHRSTSAGDIPNTAGGIRNVAQAPGSSPQALARVAVGKGIKHRFSLPQPNAAPVAATAASEAAKQAASPSALSALADNFQSSLQGLSTSQINANQPQQAAQPSNRTAVMAYVPGSMRRDDSLIDLAMIPFADEPTPDPSSATGLAFVDFPFQDPADLYLEDETL